MLFAYTISYDDNCFIISRANSYSDYISNVFNVYLSNMSSFCFRKIYWLTGKSVNTVDAANLDGSNVHSVVSKGKLNGANALFYDILSQRYVEIKHKYKKEQKFITMSKN